jgi:hypothetical protein
MKPKKLPVLVIDPMTAVSEIDIVLDCAAECEITTAAAAIKSLPAFLWNILT